MWLHAAPTPGRSASSARSVWSRSRSIRRTCRSRCFTWRSVRERRPSSVGRRLDSTKIDRGRGWKLSRRTSFLSSSSTRRSARFRQAAGIALRGTQQSSRSVFRTRAGAQERSWSGSIRFVPFDQEYRYFVELLARQISSGVAGARAFEQERMRAESLAEIDRAKTVFFSNVSHEFRTPLTLMLGPIDDLLSNPEQLPVESREALEVVQRNGQRLLKLVNTLLDFARIEAGRAQRELRTDRSATLLPPTLRATSALRARRRASRWSSIARRSPSRAYVDRDMWEKIVLNLVSNAFKFTFEGDIAVSLRAAGELVRAQRCATRASASPRGTAPHLRALPASRRSSRAAATKARGIGLALVQELVRLHGGSIRVESTLGEGSRVHRYDPGGQSPSSGRSHRRRAAAVRPGEIADVYVEEALGWHSAATPSLSPAFSHAVRIQLQPGAAHRLGRRQRRSAGVRASPAEPRLRGGDGDGR